MAYLMTKFLKVRRISYIVAFVGSLAFCLSACGSAQEDNSQMFSLFKKKNKTTTDVNPLLETVLMPADSIKNNHEKQMLSPLIIKEQYYTGEKPNIKPLPIDGSGGYDSVFYVSNEKESSSIAFVNDSDERVFETWTFDNGTFALKNKVNFNRLDASQGNWFKYFVADITPLPNDKLLIAIAIAAPTLEYRLFTYDMNSNEFDFIANIDSHTAHLEQLFESQWLSKESAIVLFYSDTKRKAAEIYHNYYNHLYLFSSIYPQGIPLLKLGIDDGNITNWSVDMDNIRLNTLDNRDPKNLKHAAWSLNISNVIKTK